MSKRSITDVKGEEELVHKAIVRLKVDAVRTHLSSRRFRIRWDELSTFDDLLLQAWMVSVSKKAGKMLHFDDSREAYREVVTEHDRALDAKRAKLIEMMGVLFQHGYRASSSLYIDFVRMAEYELAEALLRYPLNEATDAVSFEHMLIQTDWQFAHDPKAQHLLEVLVDKVIVPNLHRDHKSIQYVMDQKETTDFCFDLLEDKLWSKEEMRARKGPMKFLSTLDDQKRNSHIDHYLREPHNAADILSYIGSDSPPVTKKPRTQSGGNKTRTNSRNRGICPRTRRRRRASRCGKRSS
jgi:hypothetical protein